MGDETKAWVTVVTETHDGCSCDGSEHDDPSPSFDAGPSILASEGRLETGWRQQMPFDVHSEPVHAHLASAFPRALVTTAITAQARIALDGVRNAEVGTLSTDACAGVSELDCRTTRSVTAQRAIPLPLLRPGSLEDQQRDSARPVLHRQRRPLNLQVAGVVVWTAFAVPSERARHVLLSPVSRLSLTDSPLAIARARCHPSPASTGRTSARIRRSAARA